MTKTELNFEIIREPWNSYELDDGPNLKTRLILKRVYRKMEEDKPGYDVDAQNLTVLTHVPNDLKGKSSKKKLSPKEIQAAVIRDDVRYTTLREEWNEYIVEDGARIRLKLTVMNVGKTSQFDQNGDPIYLVNTSVIANIKPPKKFSDFEEK